MRSDDRVTELEEERDFLLRSLDDLERELAAGDIEATDYRALEEDYTARAAAVLRRLQHLDEAPAPASAESEAEAADSPDGAGPAEGQGVRASPRPRSTARRRWPMVAGIAATLALAVGSGYLVTQSSGERRPDQGVSGGPDSSPRSLLQTAIDLDNAGRLVDAARQYDAGRPRAQVARVVAGVADPPGPEQLMAMVDEVLRGIAGGDFADVLLRAAAFARVIAAGRADSPGATDADVRRMLALSEQLEAAGHLELAQGLA